MAAVRGSWLAGLALLPALSACGSADDEAPSKVTAAEARALDDAAEMIEDKRLPDSAIPPTAAPAPAASAPPVKAPPAG